MVTHPIIYQANSCLTSVIWPFTLTALIVDSCLCCTLNWGIKVGGPTIPLWKIQAMQAQAKSLGSDGEWSEYWSLAAKWVTIKDPYILSFFQFG